MVRHHVVQLAGDGDALVMAHLAGVRLLALVEHPQVDPGDPGADPPAAEQHDEHRAVVAVLTPVVHRNERQAEHGPGAERQAAPARPQTPAGEKPEPCQLGDSRPGAVAHDRREAAFVSEAGDEHGQ